MRGHTEAHMRRSLPKSKHQLHLRNAIKAATKYLRTFTELPANTKPFSLRYLEEHHSRLFVARYKDARVHKMYSLLYFEISDEGDALLVHDNRDAVRNSLRLRGYVLPGPTTKQINAAAQFREALRDQTAQLPDWLLELNLATDQETDGSAMVRTTRSTKVWVPIAVSRTLHEKNSYLKIAHEEKMKPRICIVVTYAATPADIRKELFDALDKFRRTHE